MAAWSVASGFTMAAARSGACTVICTSTQPVPRSAAQSGSSMALSAASSRSSASISGSRRTPKADGSVQVTSWTVRYFTGVPLVRPQDRTPPALQLELNRVIYGIHTGNHGNTHAMPVRAGARPPGLGTPRAVRVPQRAQAVESGLQDGPGVGDVDVDRGDGDEHVEDLFEGEVVADLASALRGSEERPAGGHHAAAVVFEYGVAAVRLLEQLGGDVAFAGGEGEEPVQPGQQGRSGRLAAGGGGL